MQIWPLNWLTWCHKMDLLSFDLVDLVSLILVIIYVDPGDRLLLILVISHVNTLLH